MTSLQKARWSGSFPLSVLSEAMKRLAPRLGFPSAPALAGHYPSVKHRDVLESIVHDIGLEQLGFDRIRKKEADFAEIYGMPPAKATTGGNANGKSGSAKKNANQPLSAAAAAASRRKQGAAQRALATGDPRAVKRLLQGFVPVGRKRDKLVALKDEIVTLDLTRTPFAFCFVIRSMFELSAKAYCADHAASGGPTTTKVNGDDRRLVDVLRDITTHLTKNNADKAKVKLLHGAIAELGKGEGMLSVTSMNQLVHNPHFSVAPADVAVVVANIFPLLEEMSR